MLELINTIQAATGLNLISIIAMQLLVIVAMYAVVSAYISDFLQNHRAAKHLAMVLEGERRYLRFFDCTTNQYHGKAVECTWEEFEEYLQLWNQVHGIEYLSPYNICKAGITSHPVFTHK